MMNANETATILQEAAHPEADILWGVMVDSTITDYVEVIIIATDVEQ